MYIDVEFINNQFPCI